MSALQLSFTLRTSSNAKTVHLLGNWDGYKGQLPLSKDGSKSGGWKGTFKFPSSTLQSGQRYWYYVSREFLLLEPAPSLLTPETQCSTPEKRDANMHNQYIIDGYHVSHDPAQTHTTEPTTGRKLNILDIPKSSSSASKPALSVSTSSTTASSRTSADKRSSRRFSGNVAIPQGRGLSPSKIVSPRPQKPNETRHLTHARYSGHSPKDIDRLSRHLSGTHVSSSSFSSESEYSDSEIDSDISSDMPSLSSGGSSRGSPSSLASPISPPGSACSCGWGVTRKGERVKLDCGGSRCSSSSDSASASSDSEEDHYRRKLDSRSGPTRRHGVVVRGSHSSHSSHSSRSRR